MGFVIVRPYPAFGLGSDIWFWDRLLDSMTRFLDVASIRRLVSSVGLEQFTVQLTGYLRDDFVRFEEFTKASRSANYFPNGVIELMPISDRSYYCFKFVNGHPGNTFLKLPTVMAFSVLAEVEAGQPILVAEATICTAIRTAATSALAASAVAPRNSKVMALIGAGAQSEFQALAFKGLLEIEEIRVYDVDPTAIDKFVKNLGATPGLKIFRAGSVEEAVRGSQVITLATAHKTHAAVLTPEIVRPGVHINAIGGDSPGKTELHPDIIETANVFVEFEPQTRHEGDIQQMTPSFQVTEIWKVLAGKHPGRGGADEVTLFDSVGFALEDFSTMRLLYDLAEKNNLGLMLDLIAKPENPKDLYGLLVG
jgi:ornithine cyclodeaminase